MVTLLYYASGMNVLQSVSSLFDACLPLWLTTYISSAVHLLPECQYLQLFTSQRIFCSNLSHLLFLMINKLEVVDTDLLLDFSYKPVSHKLLESSFTHKKITFV
jgi:hypothetical protein